MNTPQVRCGVSAAVTTARTPRSRFARLVSMPRIRACGYGLRSTAPQSIPGSITSAMYSAHPVTFSSASTSGSRRSTTASSCSSTRAMSPPTPSWRAPRGLLRPLEVRLISAQLSPKHTELIALRIRQYDPGLVALADVDAARAQADEPLNLLLLIASDRV